MPVAGLRCRLILSGFLSTRRNSMEPNTIAENTPKMSPAGIFNMKVGNATYVIGVHFSQTSKDTLEDKMRRLMRDDVKTDNF